MKIGSINVNGKSFDVWMNPKRGEFAQIGETVRFTADLTTHALYVWDFSAGLHPMSLWGWDSEMRLTPPFF